MEWDDLNRLVDAWHEAAAQLEGYRDTTDDGDGISLMLFINRTSDGNIRLSTMSSRDWISTIRPTRPDATDPDVPSIPHASITVIPPDNA